VEN
jgi:hypothetical protein